MRRFALFALLGVVASQTELAFTNTCDEQIVSMRSVHADPDPATIVGTPAVVELVLDGIVMSDHVVPDGSTFNMTAKVLGLDITADNGLLCELAADICPLGSNDPFEIKFLVEVPDCPPFGQSIIVNFDSHSNSNGGESITCLEIPIRLGCS